MIVTEVLSDNRVKSYSDNNVEIKPVYDRMGKPIPEATYGEAIDIIVDGKPRYDYAETDIKIINEEANDENEITNDEIE